MVGPDPLSPGGLAAGSRVGRRRRPTPGVATSGSSEPAAGRLRAAEAPWLLAALLLPLAINPWGLSPFVPIKLLLLWLLAAAAVGRALPIAFARWRGTRFEGLALPALALLLAAAAAAGLAPDPRQALVGSWERGMGWLTLAALVGLSLSLLQHLRASGAAAAQAARRLAVALVAGSLPVLAVASLQALGWRFGGLVTDSRSALFATLGRSNFVASYLALLLPLTLALFLLARRPLGRWTLAGLVCAQALVIAMTRNRGGLLAAAVALVAFAAVRDRQRLARLWRRPLARLAGLAGLAAVAALGLWLAQAGGSGAARLAIWQATLRLVVQRPFLGYGPDNLGVVFSRVYPPELVYYQGRELYVDRAHNVGLDTLASVGVLGLAAALATLVAVAVAARSTLRREPTEAARLLTTGIVAALAGHFVGLTVGFDTLTTATVSWLLFALAAGLAPSAAPPRAIASQPRGRGARLQTALALALAGLALASAGRLLVADSLLGLAQRRAVAADWSRSLELAEQGVEMWPGEPALRSVLADLYRRRARAQPEGSAESLAAAAAQARRAVELAPRQFRAWALLGEIQGERARSGDPEALDEAAAAYGRAVELAPNHAVLYAAWGRTLLAAGELDRAAAVVAKAVDLDATDLGSWLLLGDAEARRGRAREAAVAYGNAVSLDPQTLPALLGLAAAALDLGDLEQARRALEQARLVAPQSPELAALERRLAEAAALLSPGPAASKESSVPAPPQPRPERAAPP